MVFKAVVPAFFSLVLWTSTAAGDELAELRARNAQLEATVEELTLQLAETIAERRALEAQLADAVAKLEAAAAAATAAPPLAAGVSGETAPAPEVPAADSGAAEATEEVVEEAIVAEGATAPAAVAATAQPDSLATPACDVDEALRGYKRSGKANRALGDWLQSGNHLKACSTEQLKAIRKAVKFDFLGYEKAVLAMIDEELEAR
jgi:hypothetical protein